MLENLLQLIQEQGQDTVVNNPEVPNEKNNAVLAEAGQAVAGTMQSALANGQVDDVQHLFTSSAPDNVRANPLAQNMQNNFIDSITSKLGISKSAAMGIAASLIPMVLSKLVHRTNSTAPQDSGFSLPGLISSLTGDSSAGGLNMGNIVGQLSSMSGGGGGFNLQEIINQVSGTNQPLHQSGELQDIIKGFFNR
jgi:hypothetical protein